MTRPLAIDLFTGLHGWAEGFIAEGWRVRGFDLEDMSAQFNQPKPDHFELVLQDVLTLHGDQFADADCIVASPPCQAYSFMAMPWTRAKAKARAIRADKTGQALEDLNRLFDACFRIQAEACAAAGRHIPMVVENVKGAQPWVGRARWNFGSYYLWGDVPALMPPTTALRMKTDIVSVRHPGCTNFHQSQAQRATKNDGGSWFNIGSPGQKVTNRNPVHEGVKQGGNWFHDSSPGTLRSFSGSSGRKNPGIELGDIGFNVASAHQFGHLVEGVKIERSAEDKRQHIGTKRKFASAMIAKIPPFLSRHIAKTYSPC